MSDATNAALLCAPDLKDAVTHYMACIQDPRPSAGSSPIGLPLQDPEDTMYDRSGHGYYFTATVEEVSRLQLAGEHVFLYVFVNGDVDLTAY